MPEERRVGGKDAVEEGSREEGCVGRERGGEAEGSIFDAERSGEPASVTSPCEERDGEIVVVKDVYGCHVGCWTMLTLCTGTFEQEYGYIYKTLESYSWSLRTEAGLSTVRWQNLADPDEPKSYISR